MPLSAEQRSELMALLSDLGPGGDRGRFLDTIRELGPEALTEIGELPGLEPLRAALLRVLPDLVTDDEALTSWLRAADEALAVYPSMAREDDPMLSLARHPAWVGLAALEHAALSDEDGLDRAIRLASVGFEGSGGTAPGEVLWAMAEQAEEVGWTDRSATLLHAAHTARFDDEANRGEVRLLLGLRMAEDGDPLAAELLQSVLDAPGAARRRVHAAWVLAALVRKEDPVRAIGVLGEARALLLGEDEPDEAVIARIEEALRGLGAPADTTD